MRSYAALLPFNVNPASVFFLRFSEADTSIFPWRGPDLLCCHSRVLKPAVIQMLVVNRCIYLFCQYVEKKVKKKGV